MLTSTQYHVLSILHRQPLTFDQLTQSINLHPHRLAAVLLRLQRRGMLHKRRVIWLTVRGMETVDR